MRIKKDDNVLIISGKDRGKKGKVRKAMPREGLLVIEGLNRVKRHSRAKGQARQAGIIERDRTLPVGFLVSRLERDGAALVTRVRGLSSADLALPCRHPAWAPPSHC